MYLRSLYLKHLRCFREAELNFQYPGKVAKPNQTLPRLTNVNLLLGNNGAGKTTILRGAAMGLLAPAFMRLSGVRFHALVRRTFEGVHGRPPQFGEAAADVTLSSQDVKKHALKRGQKWIYLRLERVEDEDLISEGTKPTGVWREMFRDASPSFLVLGYGATRRIASAKEDILGRIKSTPLRYQRVQGLFEEGTTLVPLGWFLSTMKNKGRRKQVISLVDDLIGDFYKFEGHVENGDELFFRRGRSHVPMSALSDGFRAYIGWIGDMLYHICTGCPAGKKLTQNEGVVLVDEIDLHLHPEWQRNVIEKLAKTFPKIQFIFTSHSPLVTASLEWSNIWVMADPRPIQLKDEPIFGLSADQVLQSPYFSLKSARPPGVAEELRELDQRAQQGDRAAAVEFMKRIAHGSEARVFATIGAKTRKALRKRDQSKPTTSL